VRIPIDDAEIADETATVCDGHAPIFLDALALSGIDFRQLLRSCARRE
jgi:hypothetical protein